MHRARAALTILLVALTPSLAHATHAPPPPTPTGDAHWIHSGDHVLGEADLQPGAGGALDAAAPDAHVFQVQLRHGGVPSSLVRVFLHYTLDGSPPTKASAQRELSLAGSGPETLLYEVSVQPDYARNPASEVLVRFLYRIHYAGSVTEDRPEPGQAYEYLADAQAPTLGAVTLNGSPTATLDPNDALTIRVEASDASGIQRGHVRLEQGSTQHTKILQQAGTTWEASWPGGSGLQEGHYDLVVVVADQVGHEVTESWQGALRVGQAPSPRPVQDAIQVQAGQRVLYHADLTQAPRLSLDGAQAHRHHVSLEPGQNGEAVTVHLHYTLDGTAPDETGPVRELQRVQAGQAEWVYQTTLAPALLSTAEPEHVVRFYYTVQSNWFDARRIPAGGDYAYTWDAAAPRITDVQVNGAMEARLASYQELTVTTTIQDASPVHDARLQIVRDGQLRQSHPLHAGPTSYAASFPEGIGLPDGVYDLVVSAQDEHGHAATQSRPGSLVVDSTPPRVQMLRINGQATLTAKSTTALTLEARLDAADAQHVQLEWRTPEGDILQVHDLTEDGETWRLHVPGGARLPEGAYEAVITSTDTVGNLATYHSPGAVLRIDDQGPTITVLDIVYPGRQEAARAGDEVEVWLQLRDDDRVHSVRLTTPDGVVVPSYVPSHDAHYARFTAGPGNGAVHLIVTATDRAGNQAHLNAPFVLDNTAPVIGALHADLARQWARDGDTIAFRLQATDAHSSVARVFVDTSRLNPHAGVREAFRGSQSNTWTASAVVQAESGDHAVTALVVDAAGNQATHTITVPVRNGGPRIIAYTLDGQDLLVLGAPRPVRFEARLDAPVPLERLEVFLEDPTRPDAVASFTLAPEGNGVYARLHQPDLPEGSYFVRLQGTDKEGNTIRAAGNQAQLVLDLQAPTVRSFLIDTGYQSTEGVRGFFNQPVTFRARVEDQSLESVRVQVRTPSGALTDLNLTREGDAYTITQRFPEVGTFTATLLAVDAFQRNTSAARTFELAAQASPTAPASIEAATLLENGTHIAWSQPSTGGPYYGYAVSVDRAPTLADAQSGSEWTPPAEMAPGDHVLHVAAVDANGNQGPTTTIPFTMPGTTDSEAPDNQSTPSLPSIHGSLASRMRSSAPVSWTTSIPGGAVPFACFEVQARRTGTEYEVVDACTTVTTLTALAAYQNGDTVDVRVRGITEEGTVSPWRVLGTTLIDDAPPAPGAVTTSIDQEGRTHVQAQVPDDAQGVRLEVHRNGTLLSVHDMSQNGSAYEAILDDVPDNATLSVVFTDAAGNEARQDAPLDEDEEEDGGGQEPAGQRRPAWLLPLLIAILLVAGAVAVFVVRRLRDREANTQTMQARLTQEDDLAQGVVLLRDSGRSGDAVIMDQVSLSLEPPAIHVPTRPTAPTDDVPLAELDVHDEARAAVLAKAERSPTGASGRLPVAMQD